MESQGRWIAIRAAVTGLAFLCGGIVYAQEDDPVIEEKPVSQWIKQLRGDNRGLQIRAARALSGAPTNLHARVIPQVIPVLKSPRENDKFVAAQILGEYGPAARVAVADLLPMLEGTQYERNRAAAAKALGQILKDASSSEEVDNVVPSLILKFKDSYSDVRREAVRACGMIGPAAKACLPHVPPLMQEPYLGAAAYESYPVRCDAAWAVGRMGKDAVVHIDLLISLLHSDGHVNPNLVWAIGQVGPVNDNVVPNIIDKMESLGRPCDGMGLKIPALKALEGFGAKSAPAVPYLIRSLKETSGWNLPTEFGVGVLRVFAAIGPAAKEAVPIVKTFVEIKQYGPRHDGPATAKEVVAMLRKEAAVALEAITGQKVEVTNEVQKTK